MQEEGQQPAPAETAQGRPEPLQLSPAADGAGSMEVQPELLVAEPVTPPADRPGESERRPAADERTCRDRELLIEGMLALVISRRNELAMG